MPHSNPLVIQDAGIFIGSLGSVIGAGFTAWQLYFAPGSRLKEAKRLIREISHTMNSLTDEDKVAIDAYIAQVSTGNQQETKCLLNTQQMLLQLAKYVPGLLSWSRIFTYLGVFRAQDHRAEVDEALAANPYLRFPWTDLARSTKLLLDECRKLHRAVQVVEFDNYTALRFIDPILFSNRLLTCYSAGTKRRHPLPQSLASYSRRQHPLHLPQFPALYNKRLRRYPLPQCLASSSNPQVCRCLIVPRNVCD